MLLNLRSWMARLLLAPLLAFHRQRNLRLLLKQRARRSLRMRALL